MPAVLTEKTPPSRLSRIYRRIVITHLVGLGCLACYLVVLTFATMQMPIAAMNGDYDTIDLLTSAGFSADSRETFAYTPLVEASINGHAAIAELLLVRGADVNKRVDSWGGSALHWAAVRGNVAITRILLAHGAMIDLRDKQDCTPLIHAAHDGNLAVVKFLMAHGADPTLRDKEGHDARYHAEFNGHLDVVRFLKHLPKR